MSKSSQATREAWLIEKIKHKKYVDVLDSRFVDDYKDAHGAKFIPMIIGADKCNLLSKDLARMYKKGILIRYAQGLDGMGYGFPNWIYSYSLKGEK